MLSSSYSNVREFAFDVSKQRNKGISPRRIEESVFGIEAQAKNRRVQQRRESIFDVSIIRDLSRLDRGDQSRQGANSQSWTGVSKRSGIHSRRDTACSSDPCNAVDRIPPYVAFSRMKSPGHAQAIASHPRMRLIAWTSLGV